MRIRRTTTTAAAAAASLALLSPAADSSVPPLLAFTSSPTPSSRVRRRVLARSVLRATPVERRTSPSSRRRSRSRTPPSMSEGGVGSGEEGGGVAASTGGPADSTLSSLVDSQRRFELALGRTVDALKEDYPKLLFDHPRWEVYHRDLEVIDPTGVSLHGLENYKLAFGFVHAVVRWFYCEERSGVTSVRVGYDWARKCIRVSWNVELVPRMIYGGERNILHVDGISEYYLDRESGLITEHRVSHLLINDQPVRPENGIFHALAEISPGHDAEGVPVFFGADAKEGLHWEDMAQMKFQTWNPLARRDTSLFANPNESAMRLPENAASIGDNHLPYDRDALQRKNASRRKFGMPPLTPEEFVAVEEEVRAMDALNKKKAAYLAEQIAQQSEQRRNKKDGFLDSIFGGALKNGCESNFDCERPQVCCDIGIKKICCSNGLGIVDGIPVEKYQRGVLRVPLPNDNIDY
ncbi:hypothetical protein ACHAWF_017480 [Thalassiosira exigua]